MNRHLETPQHGSLTHQGRAGSRVHPTRLDKEPLTMAILITGAAGLNGTAVVHEFARHGEPIRGLVRNRPQARELDEIPIVELVEGDMLLPETLGPALDGVDRVLLISSTNARMAETQCTFIDAAKKAGVGHVVKFSGLNAAVDSAFRFTRMHGEIERHLERS